ncbi:hypothetical protein [Lyngbya sp. CCY1209]|uniref:hypothetical protein n=1 Tax=Lyngbya sp. CCY1209 TaxID=2886103 RepID=UPI002D207596|nr:hypothetical protein [Lyngbya sp. CCY1209]MEB3884189.1 hypothetical protein [Lyngbya sp. CCY1209]
MLDRIGFVFSGRWAGFDSLRPTIARDEKRPTPARTVSVTAVPENSPKGGAIAETCNSIPTAGETVLYYRSDELHNLDIRQPATLFTR